MVGLGDRRESLRVRNRRRRQPVEPALMPSIQLSTRSTVSILVTALEGIIFVFGKEFISLHRYDTKKATGVSIPLPLYPFSLEP